VARQVAPRRRIEAGGRFVHQQHRRPVQQRFGDFDAPAQPAGERLHHVLAAILQAQLRHGVFHAVPQQCA